MDPWKRLRFTCEKITEKAMNDQDRQILVAIDENDAVLGVVMFRFKDVFSLLMLKRNATPAIAKWLNRPAESLDPAALEVQHPSCYVHALAAFEQRRGIGRLLLNAIDDAAKQRGSRHVLLMVSYFNALAQRFYEREGFIHVGDISGLFDYDPAHTEHLMHRMLR